jgi:hypothetical protein
MARLVEESDDEFPELAVLICKHGRGAMSKATVDDHTKTTIVKAVPNLKAGKSNARLQDSGFDMSAKKPPSSPTKPENPQPRRRVLHNLCENPLLRPFHPESESNLSSSPSKNIKSLKQAIPMRLKLHEECRAIGGSRVSSGSEEEEVSTSDSSGLSDFIVNDSSFLEEAEEEGHSAEDGMQPCPPRSTRRLVRGRPPGTNLSDERTSTNTNEPFALMGR